MTNEEIRIKIAQAKGVIPFPFDSCPVCGFHYSTPGCTPNSCSMRPIPEIRADQKYPNWPENIADAWELIDEMPFYQIYKSQLVTGQSYYGCMCFMRLPCDEDNPDYIGEAGAVPRAICLAWLAWDAARKAEKESPNSDPS